MALKRARNKKGHYIPDDPSTPENEAYVQEDAPKPTASKSSNSGFSWYISSSPENGAFDITLSEDVKVRGSWDVQRQYVTWKVPADLNEMFKMHHHIWSGRIVPKEDD